MTDHIGDANKMVLTPDMEAALTYLSEDWDYWPDLYDHMKHDGTVFKLEIAGLVEDRFINDMGTVYRLTPDGAAYQKKLKEREYARS